MTTLIHTRRAAATLAAACALGLAPAATAGSAASPARTAVAPCPTAGLVVWLNDEAGGGAAGSFYYRLEFTNLSGRTCTLDGYPRVVALDIHGRAVGAAAAREAAGRVRRVTLGEGQSAGSQLRIVDTGALPSCGAVTAAGLRVYPPGDSAAKVVPFPFGACSHAGQGNLFVRAVAPA